MKRVASILCCLLVTLHRVAGIRAVTEDDNYLHLYHVKAGDLMFRITYAGTGKSVKNLLFGALKC